MQIFPTEKTNFLWLEGCLQSIIVTKFHSFLLQEKTLIFLTFVPFQWIFFNAKNTWGFFSNYLHSSLSNLLSLSNRISTCSQFLGYFLCICLFQSELAFGGCYELLHIFLAILASLSLLTDLIVSHLLFPFYPSIRSFFKPILSHSFPRLYKREVFNLSFRLIEAVLPSVFSTAVLWFSLSYVSNTLVVVAFCLMWFCKKNNNFLSFHRTWKESFNLLAS